MAIERQWNQPEFVQPFQDWRIGQATNTDLEFLDGHANYRQVEELRVGARELFDKTGEATEHAFSDDAMRGVRQNRDTYLWEPSIPKHELHQASVIVTADGETRFAQIYNTRLSADDLFRRMELDDGSLEALNEERLGQKYSTEQRIHSLPHNPRKPLGGRIVYRYPQGPGSPDAHIAPVRVTVADYITLGLLMQHDIDS